MGLFTFLVTHCCWASWWPQRIYTTVPNSTVGHFEAESNRDSLLSLSSVLLIIFCFQSWFEVNRKGQISITDKSVSKCSSFSKMKNDMNTICVFWAFSSILLQPLKEYVISKLSAHFVKIMHSLSPSQSSPSRKKMNERLPCDPDKPTTNFNHPKNSTSIKSLNDLAILYNGQLSINTGFNITTSTDVRAFLSIMEKAGCFNDKEAELATRTSRPMEKSLTLRTWKKCSEIWKTFSGLFQEVKTR